MDADAKVYPLLTCGLLRMTGCVETSLPVERIDVTANGAVVGSASLGLRGDDGRQCFYFDGFVARPAPRATIEAVAHAGGRRHVIVRHEDAIGAVPQLAGTIIDPLSALDGEPGVPLRLGEPLIAPDRNEIPDVPKLAVGNGFQRQSKRKAQIAKARGDITSGSRVLDVGCGLGIFAAAVGDLLDPRQGGLYWGFDIRENHVDWARRNLSARYPHVRFFTADLHFGLTEQVNLPARLYRFPFPDESFDFVVLNSVFTHMLPADVAAYLHEIARVLRPGGVCQITYFLMDEERREAVRAGRVILPRQRFAYDYGAFSSSRLVRRVEAAIAYDRAQCEERYRDAGLVVEEIVAGAWFRPETTEDAPSQDYVFARKPAR